MSTHYRINESDQERLNELSEHKAPGLDNEISLARFLAESAAKKGQGSLACALLKVVGNLSRDDLALKEMEKALLGREYVISFSKEIIAIVMDELDALNCPESEKCRFADMIVHRVCDLLSDSTKAMPETQHLLRITGGSNKPIDVEVSP